MKNLDDIEFQLLERFLIERIVVLRDFEDAVDSSLGLEPKKRGPFSLVVNVDLLNKVQSREITRYSSTEVEIINNCISRNLRNLIDEMGLERHIHWFSLSEAEWKTLQDLNTCRRILVKTGFFKKHKIFRPETHAMCERTMVVFEKIRRSTKLFIHKTVTGKIAKVAYVLENREILNFQPESNLSVFDLSFSNLADLTPDELSMGPYSIVVNPEKAAALLNGKLKYPFDKEAKAMLSALVGR